MSYPSYLNQRQIIALHIGEESRGLELLNQYNPDYGKKLFAQKGYSYTSFAWVTNLVLGNDSFMAQTAPNLFNSKLLEDLGISTDKMRHGSYICYFDGKSYQLHPLRAITQFGAKIQLSKLFSQLSDIRSLVIENPFTDNPRNIIQHQIDVVDYEISVKQKQEKRKCQQEEQKNILEECEQQSIKHSKLTEIKKNPDTTPNPNVRYSVVPEYPVEFNDMYSRLSKSMGFSLQDTLKALNDHEAAKTERAKQINPILAAEPQIREMLTLARNLYDLGFSRSELNTLLGIVNPRPAVLEVSRYGKISLIIEGKQIEVKMTPLAKALFMLFLNHPEGIYLKELVDYKKEIILIYSRFTRIDDKIAIDCSINNLLNPLRNTANENLSRIKAAFMKVLDPSEAEPYLIVGPQGGKKLIQLDRSLIRFTD